MPKRKRSLMTLKKKVKVSDIEYDSAIGWAAGNGRRLGDVLGVIKDEDRLYLQELLFPDGEGDVEGYSGFRNDPDAEKWIGRAVRALSNAQAELFCSMFFQNSSESEDKAEQVERLEKFFACPLMEGEEEPEEPPAKKRRGRPPGKKKVQTDVEQPIRASPRKAPQWSKETSRKPRGRSRKVDDGKSTPYQTIQAGSPPSTSQLKSWMMAYIHCMDSTEDHAHMVETCRTKFDYHVDENVLQDLLAECS